MSNKPTTTSQAEDQLSYYIQSQDKFGTPVYVPVIDVRDGEVERALAEQIIKAQNRSRYITYNQYHISQKSAKSFNI